MTKIHLNKFPCLLVLAFFLIILETSILAKSTLSPSVQYQYSGDVVPKNVIALNSPQGRALLREEDNSSFLGLMSYFVTEKYLSYCGIASSVMVLNALNIQPPLTPEHAPYRIFNQNNFFNNPKILKVTTPVMIGYEGATLDQLSNAIRIYAPLSRRFYAGKETIGSFRKAAIGAIKSKNKGIIINFCRKNIGEIGCGHFSPLAAYSSKEDRFLILDVARYKYPPVWVKADQLYGAMNTIDSSSKKTRGYIIVRN